MLCHIVAHQLQRHRYVCNVSFSDIGCLKFWCTVDNCNEWYNFQSKLLISFNLSKTRFATLFFNGTMKIFMIVYIIFDWAYLDRRVLGSFMTMTSVMSPYLEKYSLRLSVTKEMYNIIITVLLCYLHINDVNNFFIVNNSFFSIDWLID